MLCASEFDKLDDIYIVQGTAIVVILQAGVKSAVILTDAIFNASTPFGDAGRGAFLQANRLP
jgi:hypothetical protein